MATNWCKPRQEWQSLFASWVRTPEPRALLEAAVFFDFRPVAGSLSLAPLEDILAAAETEKLFIAHAAQEALRWGPPLGFFNRVRSDHGMVDLKKGGIGPIVNLARVGALAAGSQKRSTLERLVTAGNSALLFKREDAALLAETFEFLLHLRLRQQLTALQTNQPIDHKVRLDALSALEHRHLKEAFVTIRQVQDNVRASLHLDRMG
jgi:CBS domain-containing protein